MGMSLGVAVSTPSLSPSEADGTSLTPSLVRVAVISHTHLPRGSRRLSDSCIEHLRKSDLILHAGNFVTADVVHELERIGPPLAGVHGNVDSEEVRRMLPAVRAVDADGAKIALIHDAGPAAGRLARMRARFPDADAVVFGHSHIPIHEEAAGFQIFNPGSPTDRRRQPRHTMGLAEVERGGSLRFRVVNLD